MYWYRLQVKWDYKRKKEELYEECRLLECDAVWLLLDPSFGGTYLHKQVGKNQEAVNSSVSSPYASVVSYC
jgi:hypothetical protein